ncbi:hypothetical protein [Parasedimentitalea maritima]|uniref:hypothetical protein n=1 Tax=Parasedimentitalea maritima TaxID=2578117 RepID=UPI001484F8D3|nr:hypothetical protein [Zongyanglinia marina]
MPAPVTADTSSVTSSAQELKDVTEAMSRALIDAEKIMQPAKTEKQVAGKGA